MTYAIWSKTGGVSAHSFTSTYDNTTEVMGSTGLSNGGSVILSDEINSTADVTQTVLGLGGSVKIQNGIVGDAPDSGDDASSMVVAFNGGYAIAWVSTPTGAEASDLYLAIYDNSGVQIGSDIQVDTGHAAGSISLNGIATHTSGLISVLWSDSSTGTSYESILGEGDAPVAQSFTASLDEDTSYTFSANDFAFFDALDTAPTSITITELPTTGTLKLNGLTVSDEQEIAFADISNLVWTPDANANGYDGLVFKLRDSDGNFSQEAGVSFNIAAVADKPVTDNVHYDVDQKGSFSFKASDFTFSDADGDTLKYVVITSLATNGSLTFKGDAVEVGDKIAAGQLSKLVYTAPTNKAGDDLASYGFQLEDSAGDLSLAKNITIDVNAVNTAPVAKDDAANAYVDKALKIDVLGNDTDKDGDSLTITKATLEKGAPGEVTIKNGQLVYDSGNVKSLEHGETKTFTISYTVSDGASTDKANVTVTLGHANDIFGTQKKDAIDLRDTDSYLFAGGGDDNVAVFGRGNRVFGGDGGDTLIAHVNGIELYGGDGDDYIRLAAVAYGGDGNDQILGAAYADGGDGNDFVLGSSGLDRLYGGRGNDTVHGKVGNDQIYVGVGNDVVSGGDGRDTFHIMEGKGEVSIMRDSSSYGGDVIDISAFDFSGVAELRKAAKNEGGFLVVKLDEDSSLRFETPEVLSSSHYWEF
ncbi:calcium-binding protein [Rhizobium alvei]|uniref:Ig-like domain-containing protein n=1 Tax=Rhizobium alvei TaxID=1132659 RepID=A0ABT8YHW0_9HYPH|nr:Ig-like domain-containing protein [Rhizobium alvei]MDO6963179.1 Ig-like domain-containing protein [Rhizobium alvei]